MVDRAIVIKPDLSTVIAQCRPLKRHYLIVCGLAVVVIAVLWLLRNANVIPTGLLGPLIVGVAGLALLAKAAYM